MKKILLTSGMVVIQFFTTFVYAHGSNEGHGMRDERGRGHMKGSSSEEIIDNKERPFRSNGERIYYTGISERGGIIPFKGGPLWLRVHGGSCVYCHGETGKGGVPVMMGTPTPPDIRYRILTVEEHYHGGVNEKHQRYTDNLIKRAITQGLNPDGKPLDQTMPRYSMTKEDMDDLIEYIKTLK